MRQLLHCQTRAVCIRALFHSLPFGAARNCRRMKFSRTFSCCLLFCAAFFYFFPLARHGRALGGSVTALSPGQKFCFAAQCDDIVLFRASGVAPRACKSFAALA
jgi:hypothetical protein